MPLTVAAVYENGVLKPVQPLPLKEHAKVRVTIPTEAGPLVQAQGIMGWTGDAETLGTDLAGSRVLSGGGPMKMMLSLATPILFGVMAVGANIGTGGLRAERDGSPVVTSVPPQP